MPEATSNAILRVERGQDDALVYTLSGRGEPRRLVVPTRADVDGVEALEALEALETREGGDAMSRTGAAGGGDLGATFAARIAPLLVPAELGRLLGRSGADRSEAPLLAIACDDAELAALPWESALYASGLLGLRVVRLARAQPRQGDGQSAPPRALVVGFTQHGRHQMPGIRREIEAVAGFLRARVDHVSVLSDPTFEELAGATSSVRPSLVHLAHPCLGGARGEVEPFALMPSEGSAPRLVSLAELAALFAGARPKLIVLNARHGGDPRFGARIAREAGAATLVWQGPLDDDLAAGFALYLYRRLGESPDLVEAVRAFAEGPSLGGGLRRTPLVFVPSLDTEGLCPLALGRSEAGYRGGVRGPRETVYRGGEPAMRSGSGDDLKVDIDFVPSAAICPALLMNGRSVVEKLAIETSNPSRPRECLELSIECDTGSGASTFRQTIRVAEGRETIPTDKLVFPILYELIRKEVDRRYISFSAAVRAGGRVVAEVTRPVLWMGHSEWMDQEEVWPFIPAFVRPHDPGVLAVFDHAMKKPPKAGLQATVFSGYQEKNRDRVVQQARAIFEALRDEPLKVSYINPAGSPVYLSGKRVPAGQRVRFPGAILEHKRGTCHDLALLFAGCAEHVQIYPLVILMEGHTFAGFWTNAEAHAHHWSVVELDRIRAESFGGMWTITAANELEALVEANEIMLLECTLVTDARASYEKACAEGQRRMKKRGPHSFAVAVDIWASRHMIQPI